MSLTAIQSMMTILLTFVKESLFGKSALATLIKRNKLTTLFAVTNIFIFGMLLFMADQALTRTKQLDAETKLRTQLQQNFDKLVPPNTPRDEAPLVIIKELVRIDYESKQCKQELDAVKSVLEENATQDTANNLKGLLEKLRSKNGNAP